MHENKVPTQFLPAYCNWMCEFHLPKYNKELGKFVEPYLPFHPLALVHLAGLDQIRANKKILLDIKTTNNEVIKKSLRFNA